MLYIMETWQLQKKHAFVTLLYKLNKQIKKPWEDKPPKPIISNRNTIIGDILREVKIVIPFF